MKRSDFIECNGMRFRKDTVHFYREAAGNRVEFGGLEKNDYSAYFNGTLEEFEALLFDEATTNADRLTMVKALMWAARNTTIDRHMDLLISAVRRLESGGDL